MPGSRLALLALQPLSRHSVPSLRCSARYLRTQVQYDYANQEQSYPYQRPADLATPKELVQYLNGESLLSRATTPELSVLEYVIGQEQAKKVLSVALVFFTL
jgi:ATP-dependent protease Clp ATPase subunit